MAREDSNSSLSYHDETKHSELSVRISAHYLDWEDKPSAFKVYRNLPSIPLPRDFPSPREASLRVIKEVPPKTIAKHIGVGILAEILFFSAGLTRKITMGKMRISLAVSRHEPH